MLRVISTELATALAARGCPYRVVYGPEQGRATSAVDTRIVVERDRQGKDAFEVAGRRAVNPAVRGVRKIGFRITVFAHSNLAGADVYNHERLADQIVDQVLIALRGVCETRHTTSEVVSCGLMSREELTWRELEAWPGVVYSITGRVDRAVIDRTWAGEAADEYTLSEGQISNTAAVSYATGSGSTSAECSAAEEEE